MDAAEASHVMKQSALGDLNAFTETLVQLAFRVASYQRLTNDEQEKLVDQGQALEGAVREIIKIIVADFDNRHETVHAHGLSQLRTALIAAYMIGTRANESPIALRFAKEARAAHTAPARQSKKTISQTTDDLIMELAKPLWERHRTWANNRIASGILEPLNRRLKEQHLRPMRIDAIRKRVKSLRPDRTTVQSSG
jgi:hypothetical protein